MNKEQDLQLNLSTTLNFIFDSGYIPKVVKHNRKPTASMKHCKDILQLV